MRAPPKGMTRELQVGLFVFTACLAIVAFSFRLTDLPLFRQGTEFVAYFDDATGFFKDSKVKMAGINIGLVQAVELEHGRAKVTLLINKGVDLPKDAQIYPRSMGILGEKYLEIVLPKLNKPGGENLPPETPSIEEVPKSEVKHKDQGQWQHRRSLYESIVGWFIPQAYAQQIPAVSSQEIPESIDKATRPNVLKTGTSGVSLEDVTKQLASVAEDLKSISSALRQIMTRKEHVDSPVGRTLKNIELVSGNLNLILEENRKDFNKTLAGFSRITNKIDVALEGLDQAQLKKDLKALGMSAGNLGDSLERLKSIMKKIDDGEGTLGKLVNDPTAANQLTKTLQSVNEAVSRVQRTKIEVDTWAQYNAANSKAKVHIGLIISPREDSAFLGQMTIGSSPVEKTVVEEVSVNDGATTSTKTITRDDSKFRYSLQYVKRFWDLGLRMGLFESSGGGAIDYTFYRKHGHLSVELFGLGERGTPVLKTYARGVFMEYFNLYAGAENILHKKTDPLGRRFSVFAGLGLRFTENDFGSLLLFRGVQ